MVAKCKRYSKIPSRHQGSANTKAEHNTAQKARAKRGNGAGLQQIQEEYRKRAAQMSRVGARPAPGGRRENGRTGDAASAERQNRTASGGAAQGGARAAAARVPTITSILIESGAKIVTGRAVRSPKADSAVSPLSRIINLQVRRSAPALSLQLIRRAAQPIGSPLGNSMLLRCKRAMPSTRFRSSIYWKTIAGFYRHALLLSCQYSGCSP